MDLVLLSSRFAAAGYLAATLCCGCGLPVQTPDASGDASMDARIDCSPETEWLYYEYEWGDMRGETGCVSAAFSEHQWESPNRTAPARRVYIGYRGEAARDSTRRGLPSGICGAALVLENLPLVSDTGGGLVDATDVTGDGHDPNAYVLLLYEESTITGEECDGELRSARLRGGQWFIRVGADVGDFVRAEARDVMFEDVRGRSVFFPEMHWQARVDEPIVFR